MYLQTYIYSFFDSVIFIYLKYIHIFKDLSILIRLQVKVCGLVPPKTEPELGQKSEKHQLDMLLAPFLFARPSQCRAQALDPITLYWCLTVFLSNLKKSDVPAPCGDTFTKQLSGGDLSWRTAEIHTLMSFVPMCLERPSPGDSRVLLQHLTAHVDNY